MCENIGKVDATALANVEDTLKETSLTTRDSIQNLRTVRDVLAYMPDLSTAAKSTVERWKLVLEECRKLSSSSRHVIVFLMKILSMLEDLAQNFEQLHECCLQLKREKSPALFSSKLSTAAALMETITRSFAALQNQLDVDEGNDFNIRLKELLDDEEFLTGMFGPQWRNVRISCQHLAQLETMIDSTRMEMVKAIENYHNSTVANYHEAKRNLEHEKILLAEEEIAVSKMKAELHGLQNAMEQVNANSEKEREALRRKHENAVKIQQEQFASLLSEQKRREQLYNESWMKQQKLYEKNMLHYQEEMRKIT